MVVTVPALAVMRMGSQVSSLLMMTEGGLLAVRETVHLRVDHEQPSHERQEGGDALHAAGEVVLVLGSCSERTVGGQAVDGRGHEREQRRTPSPDRGLSLLVDLSVNGRDGPVDDRGQDAAVGDVGTVSGDDHGLSARHWGTRSA